ncbi:MAG: NADP-dependent oxidoreductase [Burkholderiales bacterium]
MATMTAAVIREFGDASKLTIESVRRPVPREAEVLVKVHAASINPIDFKTRAGTGVNRGWKDLQFPLILGWDISGVVAESNSPRFKQGDAVFALSRFPTVAGAYAQYACVPERELALKPASLDFAHAAAVPLAALTAWQALFDNAGLCAGQTVLVHAAAGGVGHLAVQLAKNAGAKVIGTASTRNKDYVLSLGVDQFIDYTQAKFEEVSGMVDVVFHTIGADMRPRSWSIVKKGGWLVAITGPVAENEGAQYGANGKFISVRPNGEQLTKIGKLIDSGTVKIAVEKTYSLEEIAKAHQHVELGRTRGKVVIAIPD